MQVLLGRALVRRTRRGGRYIATFETQLASPALAHLWQARVGGQSCLSNSTVLAMAASVPMMLSGKRQSLTTMGGHELLSIR